jgi:hypothetical protein
MKTERQRDVLDTARGNPIKEILSLKDLNSFEIVYCALPQIGLSYYLYSIYMTIYIRTSNEFKTKLDFFTTKFCS